MHLKRRLCKYCNNSTEIQLFFFSCSGKRKNFRIFDIMDIWKFIHKGTDWIFRLSVKPVDAEHINPATELQRFTGSV